MLLSSVGPTFRGEIAICYPGNGIYRVFQRVSGPTQQKPDYRGLVEMFSTVVPTSASCKFDLDSILIVHVQGKFYVPLSE
jgi:hypothetical protein